ncbi:MAG: hypothetical protein HFE96_02560 [Acutalibacter sp.]|nr:hypothetical protein [Acutalibacter sp.]
MSSIVLHRKRTEQKLKCSIVVLRVKRVIVKLTKRLVALLLALMLVVGVFTMSAAAYSCGSCGSSQGYVTRTGSWSTGSGSRVESCGNHSGVHYHYYAAAPGRFHCNNCGKETIITLTNPSFCPYA